MPVRASTPSDRNGKYARRRWIDVLSTGGGRASVDWGLPPGTQAAAIGEVPAMDAIFLLIIVGLLATTLWLAKAIAHLRGDE